MDGDSKDQEQQSQRLSTAVEQLEIMNVPEGGQPRVETMYAGTGTGVDSLPQPEVNLKVPVGMYDRSMRVIMPASSPCAVKTIHSIRLLDDFLSLSSTRQVLDEILTPIPKTKKRKRLKKKTQQQRVGRDDNDPDVPPPGKPDIIMNGEAIHSLRFIQAGRYEIFVQARGKKAHVFDWLCEQVWSKQQQQHRSATTSDVETCEFYNTPQEMKQAIIEYAIQQAERDDRITANIQNKQSISYDNFSLIVSYDPVVAQPQHIDLLYPNFQFGLMVTDHSPGTNVYAPPHTIRTVTDMKNYVWTDMTSTIATAMQQDALVSSLLSQFGDVLCPNIEQVHYWEPCNNSTSEDLSKTACEDTPPDETKNDECSSTSKVDAYFPTGTLLSLPGSVIHAGPPSNKYRTVLFFSACPDVRNTIPYHPDTQYFAPLLCCDFVSLLWDNLGASDRIYLLNRLLDSIRETKCEHLERHITDSKLIRFLNTVTNWDEKKKKLQHRVTKYRKYKTMNDYIRAFAVCGKLFDSDSIGIDVIGTIHNDNSYGQNSVPPGNEMALGYQSITTLLSVPNLVVEFEGRYFPAQVFEYQPTTSVMSLQIPSQNDANEIERESTNIVKVMLFYPTDQSWEGSVNPYTLEWKQEENVPVKETLDGAIETLDKRRLFDGINGILRDNEGIIVPCSPQCLTSVSSHHDDSMMKVQRKPSKRRKSIIPYSVRPRKRQNINTTLLSTSIRTNAAPISDNIAIASTPIMYKNDDNRDLQRGISKVNENDVICGMNGSSTHVGNRNFLELVKSIRITDRDETSICNSIINSVHDSNGRFLRQDDTSGLWYELSFTDAQIRCYRALRRHRNCVNVTKANTSPLPKSARLNVQPISSINAIGSTTSTSNDNATGVRHFGSLEVKPVDVLCNGSRSRHPGNSSFVDLVKLFCPTSDSISRRDRLTICNSIIKSVHDVNGRFLRLDDISDLWYEVSMEEAQNRCLNALYNHMRLRRK